METTTKISPCKLTDTRDGLIPQDIHGTRNGRPPDTKGTGIVAIERPRLYRTKDCDDVNAEQSAAAPTSRFAEIRKEGRFILLESPPRLEPSRVYHAVQQIQRAGSTEYGRAAEVHIGDRRMSYIDPFAAALGSLESPGGVAVAEDDLRERFIVTADDVLQPLLREERGQRSHRCLASSRGHGHRSGDHGEGLHQPSRQRVRHRSIRIQSEGDADRPSPGGLHAPIGALHALMDLLLRLGRIGSRS